MRGLFRSNVYVLLFSDAGLRRLLALTPASEVDNVLLEIRLARELYYARGEDAFQVRAHGGKPGGTPTSAPPDTT